MDDYTRLGEHASVKSFRLNDKRAADTGGAQGRSVTGFAPGPGSSGQSPPRDSASSSSSIEW